MLLFWFFLNGLRELDIQLQLIKFAERCGLYSYFCWYCRVLQKPSVGEHHSLLLGIMVMICNGRDTSEVSVT